MRLLPLVHLLYGTAVGSGIASATSNPPNDKQDSVPPSQDSFYGVPKDIANAAPGEVLRHRVPDATFSAFGYEPKVIREAHQFLYRTSDNTGNATATVLSVFIPRNANMSRVISYQVAENAAFIDCAPSFGFQSTVADYKPLVSATMQLQLLIVQSALERGWVVIVPDFQGPLGALGANSMAAKATLDGIRAALSTHNTTGIDPEADVVLWGYSGGASTTQAAAAMQPLYAPELRLTGAALGGISSELGSADDILRINKDPRTGILASILIGISSQYENFKNVLDAQLKSQYRKMFYSPLHQCLEANLHEFRNADLLAMFSDFHAVLNSPTLLQVAADNLVNMTTPETPMLWYQCLQDDIAPIDSIDKMYENNCAQGAVIEYIKDSAPNLLHRNYGVVGAPGALEWIEARFKGEDEPKRCSEVTKNTPDIDLGFLKLFPDHIAKALVDLAGSPNKTAGELFG